VIRIESFFYDWINFNEMDPHKSFRITLNHNIFLESFFSSKIYQYVNDAMYNFTVQFHVNLT